MKYIKYDRLKTLYEGFLKEAEKRKEKSKSEIWKLAWDCYMEGIKDFYEGIEDITIETGKIITNEPFYKHPDAEEIIIPNKLNIAKKIIQEHYKEANCGIFNCRNTVGDPMTQIYGDGDLFIDICYYYSYFEVFGLSNDEFKELEKFYDSLEDE